ncbi:alpha-ketoglutarate-dependent dioxygenase alkB homolog 4 isoform X1 [Clupea harengus]|uniref:Alpha-ketoglutarate-dependent dioxygenase alkB homolog 4 isoform X1 n=2 Tax=Clupea harengus TaxID=7950 RepID=A0A6P3VPC9_CLUHA|nr:alpha-ketoglutarate-dependent dioxygenase alkB homolog 4 isoform X1 [Clupea harengus]
MASLGFRGASVCGCKGIRTCLTCEKAVGKLGLTANEIAKGSQEFTYNPLSGQAIRCVNGVQESFPFPGVFLRENFVTEEEERDLVSKMDEDIWRESQSGRTKQDFGPKVNFKKRRVRVGGFCGLPSISQKLVVRMNQEPLLNAFQPVEQCNLDYNPQRGSSIDPHLDDSWLWGERLVTINLLSDTILTMSLDEGCGQFDQRDVSVYVHLSRRSLVVLYGEARHQWKHAIHRRDIHNRRVCSTFRELSAEFLPGGEQADTGSQLLDIASTFHGVPL